MSKAPKAGGKGNKKRAIKPANIEEQKAQILVKLRGYKIIKRKRVKNASGFLAKDAENKEMLIWCLPSKGTIGVQYAKDLRKAMEKEKVSKAMVVTSGRYTQACRVHSKEDLARERQGEIELIPRIFPAFNIFEHVLVPKHEIILPEERKNLLLKYRVEPYQLPRVKASDPAVIAIGAKPGDIVRVIRDSDTAGKYVSYRHVVEG